MACVVCVRYLYSDRVVSYSHMILYTLSEWLCVYMSYPHNTGDSGKSQKTKMSNFMAIFGKLEKYNGSEDLATWLQKFNRCCAIADKMEDNVRGKLIMLCLTGQPLTVAEQLEHERQTYDQVRIRLESVFDSSAKREQRMEAFEKRILLAGESVDQFMLALVQLYRSANPNAVDREFQMAVKRKFLQGLPPKLRQSVYVFVNDPYSQTVNYQRLLEYTRNAEIAFVDETNNDMSVNAVAQHPMFIPTPTAMSSMPMPMPAPMSSMPMTMPGTMSSMPMSIAGAGPSNTDVMNAISSLSQTLHDHVNVCGINAFGGARSRNPSQSRNRGRNNNSNNRNNNNNNGRNNNNRNNNNNNDNRNPVICHKCGFPNHIAPDCKKKN